MANIDLPEHNAVMFESTVSFLKLFKLQYKYIHIKNKERDIYIYII